MTPIAEKPSMFIPPEFAKAPEAPSGEDLLSIARYTYGNLDLLTKGSAADQYKASEFKKHSDKIMEFWAILFHRMKEATLEEGKFEYERFPQEGMIPETNTIMERWIFNFGNREEAMLFITTPETGELDWFQIDLSYNNEKYGASFKGTSTPNRPYWNSEVSVSLRPDSPNVNEGYNIKLQKSRIREITLEEAKSEQAHSGLVQSKKRISSGGTVTFDWNKFDQAQAQVAAEAQG